MRTAVGTTFTVFTFFNTSASYMLLDHSKTAVSRLRPTLSEARSPFSRFQRTPQLTPLPGGGAGARLLKRIASAPSWQSTSSMLSAAISALVAVSVAGAALLAAQLQFAALVQLASKMVAWHMAQFRWLISYVPVPPIQSLLQDAIAIATTSLVAPIAVVAICTIATAITTKAPRLAPLAALARVIGRALIAVVGALIAWIVALPYIVGAALVSAFDSAIAPVRSVLEQAEAARLQREASKVAAAAQSKAAVEARRADEEARRTELLLKAERREQDRLDAGMAAFTAATEKAAAKKAAENAKEATSWSLDGDERLVLAFCVLLLLALQVLVSR